MPNFDGYTLAKLIWAQCVISRVVISPSLPMVTPRSEEQTIPYWKRTPTKVENMHMWVVTCISFFLIMCREKQFNCISRSDKHISSTEQLEFGQKMHRQNATMEIYRNTKKLKKTSKYDVGDCLILYYFFPCTNTQGVGWKSLGRHGVFNPHYVRHD